MQEARSSIPPERIPQLRGINNISGDFELPCQNPRRRFERRFLGGGHRGYRPPTLGHRNGAPVFLDFVEQGQAFGFELGSANDLVLHTVILPHSEVVI